MAGPVSTRQALSRRAFLRRAGVGAAGVAIAGPALLAACSKSASSLHEVRVFNQPLAMDEISPALFERESGDFLRYHEYVDPAAFLVQKRTALRAHRDVGADVVVVPDHQTAQMIEGGWVRVLEVPDARQRILPAFARPHFDPERRFSVPWSSTIVGLAYDRRYVVDPVRSANALFDPRFKGKVALSADSDATLGMVVLASGNNPATVTESHAAAAVDRVRGAVATGHVRSFATTEYVDDLVSRRALIAIARADEIRGALQISPTLAFVVPSEGGLLESTNMVVPLGARNVTEAGDFIDFMSTPTASSRLASFSGQVMAIKGAVDNLTRIDVKASLDPLIQPDPSVWARLSIWGLPAGSRAVADFAAIVASHASAQS